MFYLFTNLFGGENSTKITLFYLFYCLFTMASQNACGYKVGI